MNGLWQNTLTWYKNKDVEGQEKKEKKKLISFLSKFPHASFAIQQPITEGKNFMKRSTP